MNRINAINLLRIYGTKSDWMKVLTTRHSNPAVWRMVYGAYLATPLWQEKRRERIDLDGGKCVSCGATAPIEVHHTNYATIGDEDVAHILTLCQTCHKIEHKIPPQMGFETQLSTRIMVELARLSL